MKIEKVVSIVFLFFFFSSHIVLAEILNVPSEYQSIQAAINASFASDIIIVSDGTYSGQGNRDIDFNGKAIIVRSLKGAEVTIIDCQGSYSDKHRGFFFHSGETTSSVVNGFTIMNGYGPDEPFSGGSFSVGGGIYCTNYSSPLITNNIITNNTAQYGGGIQCYDHSSPTITNNTISENSGNGGGINCYTGCSAKIENNIITENSAGYGGGLKIDASSTVEVSNNIIAKNIALGKGGGIYCGNASPTFFNNTVTDNTCQNEGEGGGAYFWSASPTIVNTIFWGNNGGEISHGAGSIITITYSDIQGGQTGEGNIDSDPLFVDATNNDLHLQLDSPCIDTGTTKGTPADDIEGYLRPIGASHDMGAYEYHYYSLLWQGYSDNWNDAQNWQPSMVPTVSNAVVISGLPIDRVWPIVNEFNSVAEKFLIESGTLTIDQGKLTISDY